MPEPVRADQLIDTLEEIVGVGGLQYLQHLGGLRFLAAVSSMDQATKLVARGVLLIAGKEVQLEQMGAPVVYVTIYLLPPCVSDDALAAALAPYGKVRSVSEVAFQSKTHVRNGTRLVKLEMTRAPSNFLVVTGTRVMLE